MGETDETKMRSDLQSVMGIPEVEAVLLFGSHARGDATQRSDVDICVVAPTANTTDAKASLVLTVWSKVNAAAYDIWLFEELPLYMQIEVIENHHILHCRDVPSLYEYFYWFRKRWSQQEQRQALTA